VVTVVAMSDADDVRLALQLLLGFQKRTAARPKKLGRTYTVYFDQGSNEERQAKQALARVLGRVSLMLGPMQEAIVLSHLAALFDEDASIPSRKLEFKGRGPGRPRQHTANQAIVDYIEKHLAVQRKRGATNPRIGEAVKSAMKRYKLGERRVWAIWGENGNNSKNKG
jgi:hypothetical protein